MEGAIKKLKTKVGKTARRQRRMDMSRARPIARRRYAPSVRQVETALNKVKRRNAHYVDLASATYGLDTTGSVTLVAAIPQGAAEVARIGKKAQYKSFQLNGSVDHHSSTATTQYAYMLVYDREPTGALPNITDILNTISASSFNNDANSDRFKILRRWDGCIIGGTTTLTSKSAVNVHEYVKCNLPIQFKNVGTGAIGDIAKGAVYLVTVGSHPAGTSSASLIVRIRTRFIDTDG